MKFISIYTTLPDENITKKIANKLIEGRLVACVNYYPIKSIYRWKGNIEKDDEYALIMKSKGSLYTVLENRLKELHPYEIPAIVTYKIEESLDEYLLWIEEETKRE